jgi:hypothetical protein
MTEEHWLVKPGTASELLSLSYGQLERRSPFLSHVVTPGGGQRLYLYQYLEKLVEFINVGTYEGDPYISFAQTAQARALGQAGFCQLLQLITFHATEQDLLTNQAIAAILGVSEHAVKNWHLDRIGYSPATYLTSIVMQSLSWQGPGVSY